MVCGCHNVTALRGGGCRAVVSRQPCLVVVPAGVLPTGVLPAGVLLGCAARFSAAFLTSFNGSPSSLNLHFYDVHRHPSKSM